MKKWMLLTVVLFCLGLAAAPMASVTDASGAQDRENEIQYVDITTLIFIDEEMAQANLYETE